MCKMVTMSLYYEFIKTIHKIIYNNIEGNKIIIKKYSKWVISTFGLVKKIKKI